MRASLKIVQHLAQSCLQADTIQCMHLHMAASETNRAKIVSRLEAEGWVDVGGGNHDKFIKADVAYPVIVPRHRTLSPGVARSIAKAASWT